LFRVRAASPLKGALVACGLLLALYVASARGQFEGSDSSPPRRSSDAAADAAGDYRAYSLKHKDVRDVERMLGELLANFGDSAHVLADPRANRILLRGPERAQQIARQLIESIDRPAPAEREVKSTLRVYRVSPARADEAARSLKLRYADDPRIRITVDADGAQLLILAPADVHDDIARQLSPRAPLPEQLGGDRRAFQPRAAEPRAPLSGPPRERFVLLENTRADRVEGLFRDIFGERLKPADVDAGYVLTDSTGTAAELQFDRRQNGVALRAPEPQLGQLARLIGTLDSPPQSAGKKIRIVPIRRADPRKVQQAIDAYRRGYRAPGSRPSVDDGQSRLWPADARSPYADDGEANRYRRGRFTQVAYQEDAPAAAPQDGQNADMDDRRRVRELGSEVDIETLDDLDVIILRGNDRDVEEVSRIIREIERLSAETQPEVEIVSLEHVGSEALAELLTKLNVDLVGSRQGRVSVTPLVKPNAVLLVGWGEAVAAVKALIAKLDQPVDAETQFRVFRLRHATAAAAGTNLQSFYANRTGLGAKVRIIPDPRTNALLVQASPRDMVEIERLIERIDTPDSGAVHQARIFKLKHALAADVAATLNAAIDAARGGTGGGAAAAQKSAILELLTVDAQGQRLLKSGILSDVRITPDPQQNALVVSAPAESMELLEALIRQLDDAPAAAAQIKVFRIVNGDATGLVQMLRALLPSQPGNVGPQLATAQGESSLAPLRFAVDLRTNSIIATGSTGDLKIIEALLLRLDEKEVQMRKNAVYRLKNAPAADVARAINDFLRSERQVQQAAPGNVSPFQQIESEVVVVPEPVSNTLILSATPRFFDEIEELVERLDAQPPQVMIQVLIAEVQLNDADEFGVELGIQDSLLFDRSLLGDLITTTNTVQTSTPAGILTSTNQVIQAATNTPGYNFNGTPLPGLGNSGSEQSLATAGSLAGQALSNFAMNRLNSELGFGGLVMSASSESVSILVRALQESRRLEILSRPQVMTLDNQPAFIQVGQRVPRIVGSTINQLGQINTIELENVGLIIAVTPRISPEGMVVMEIDAEKSELGPEAEGIPVSISNDGGVIRSPRINLTTAQTTVSAADGETIVLGGLITKGTSQVHRRVPWLADLPLLGNLFRYDSLLSKRTELLIIMTPHVVRSSEDVDRIRQIEAARMHWCCADVHEIHGEGGLCNNPNCPLCNAEIPVIYPDLDPRGHAPDGAGRTYVDPAYEADVPRPADAKRNNPRKAQRGDASEGRTGFFRRKPRAVQTSKQTAQPVNPPRLAVPRDDAMPLAPLREAEEAGPYIPEFDDDLDPRTSDAGNAARRGAVRPAGATTDRAASAGETDRSRIAEFPPGWRQ